MMVEDIKTDFNNSLKEIQENSLGQALFWDPDIQAPSLQEKSLTTESTLTTGTQKRASLPGLLIEANRIT